MESVLLDRWLPAYEFEEHHSIAVAAAPEAVSRALHEVSLNDAPLVRGLWTLRSLPARLRGRTAPSTAPGPLLDGLVGLGGVLLEDGPGIVVTGLGGAFWRLSGNIERFGDAEAFAVWDAAGSGKAVVDFVWGDGRLGTTTRVHVPDDAARRRFRGYWLVVRPFSGLIRRAILRAVKQKAETYDRSR